jgi:hypothetical protein
MIHTMQ